MKLAGVQQNRSILLCCWSIYFKIPRLGNICERSESCQKHFSKPL